MVKRRSLIVTGVAALALAGLVSTPAMAMPAVESSRPELPAKSTMPATYKGTFTSTPDAGSSWRGTVKWRYANMEGSNAVFLPVSGTVAWTYSGPPECTAAPNAGTVALTSSNGVLRLHPVKGGTRRYEVLVDLTSAQQPKVTLTCPDPDSETGGTYDRQVTVPVGGEGYILLSNSVNEEKTSSFFTDAKGKKLVGDLDHPPAAAFQHWVWKFTGSGSKKGR